jgi:hypothetical protein
MGKSFHGRYGKPCLPPKFRRSVIGLSTGVPHEKKAVRVLHLQLGYYLSPAGIIPIINFVFLPYSKGRVPFFVVGAIKPHGHTG